MMRSWRGSLPGLVRVVYEAGPTGFGLARFLLAAGIVCVVAAPSKLQRPVGDGHTGPLGARSCRCQGEPCASVVGVRPASCGRGTRCGCTLVEWTTRRAGAVADGWQRRRAGEGASYETSMATARVGAPKVRRRAADVRRPPLATTQRADLAVTWLCSDPARPGQVLTRRHCRRCQPHGPVLDLACAMCGDGPILAGALATAAIDAGPPPKPVQQWLAADGWQLTPELLCPDHIPPAHLSS